MIRSTITGAMAFLGALSLPVLFQNCGGGGFQRSVQVQAVDANGDPINVGPSPLEGQYYVFSSQSQMCIDNSCASEAIFFLSDQRMIFDGEGGYELQGACGNSTGTYAWRPEEGRTHALSFEVPSSPEPSCANAEEELMLKALLSDVEGLEEDISQDYVEMITSRHTLGDGEINQTRLFLVKEDVAFPNLTDEILHGEFWLSEIRRYNCPNGDVGACTLEGRDITTAQFLEFAPGGTLDFSNCNALSGSYDLGEQDLAHRKPITLSINNTGSAVSCGGQSLADQNELFEMVPQVRSLRLVMVAGDPNLHLITHSGEILVFRPR